MSQDALYNKSSSDHRALIKVWERWANKGEKAKPSAGKPLEEHELIAKIPDAALRAVFGGIIAERNRLRGQVNVLRAQTNIVIDRRPVPGVIRRGEEGSVVQVLPALADLTPTEKTALQAAISPATLDREGWSEGPNGEILNDRGRSILPMGFAHAIRKVLQGADK